VFRDFNVNAFIEKPFNLEQFLNTLEEVLAGSKKDAAAAQVPGAGAPLRPAAGGTPRKVLIVEDDDYTFGRLVTTFMHAGYQVISVMNPGEDIVSEKTEKRILLSLQVDRPDALLMKFDGAHPDGRETELAARLRAQYPAKDLGIILYPSHPAQIEAAQAGRMLEKTGASRVLTAFEPAALLRESEALVARLRADAA
jgi:DNA-binding response OmpR family regulator